MRSKYLPGALFPLLLSLVACNVAKNQRLAEASVTNFHAQLDGGEFRSIYEQSDESLKQAAKEEDFVAMLQAVHQKLGLVKNTEERTYKVGLYTGPGTVVTMSYATSFATGAGTEQFTWHLRGNHAQLVGYFIASSDIVK